MIIEWDGILGSLKAIDKGNIIAYNNKTYIVGQRGRQYDWVKLARDLPQLNCQRIKRKKFKAYRRKKESLYSSFTNDSTFGTQKSAFENEVISLLRQSIINVINDTKKYIDDGLSPKIISEIMSQKIGNGIKMYFDANISHVKVKSCKSDNDFDVIFSSINTTDIYNLEIKVCKGSKEMKTCQWRGGEFSKRECDHLLLNWIYNESTKNFEIYACILYLKKDEWTSNIERKYYAPTIGKKYLFTRKDRIEIFGNLKYRKLQKLNIDIIHEVI